MHNFEMQCICEEPLLPDKGIFTIYVQIQRSHVPGKLFMKFYFGLVQSGTGCSVPNL